MSNIKVLLDKVNDINGEAFLSEVTGIPKPQALIVKKRLMAIQERKTPDRIHINLNKSKHISAHICYGKCEGDTGVSYPLYEVAKFPYQTSWANLWTACYASIFGETWCLDGTLAQVFSESWMKHMLSIRHGDNFSIMEKTLLDHAIYVSGLDKEEFMNIVRQGVRAHLSYGIACSLKKESAKIPQEHIENIRKWELVLDSMKGKVKEWKRQTSDK